MINFDFYIHYEKTTQNIPVGLFQNGILELLHFNHQSNTE